jgi:hypothetical protein
MDKRILLCRTQRVRIGGQLPEEVRIKSGVPQKVYLVPILFLAYVNIIWRNIESTIRLFTNGCIMYRKILNNNDIENLQI